jgi:hypothetical protein
MDTRKLPLMPEHTVPGCIVQRPTLTELEAIVRDAIGATSVVVAAWDTMSAEDQQPWRDRERALLDTFVAELLAAR